MNVLLDIRNITVHYGKSVAIEDVSLQVTDGGLVSIIGANGAGKSTVLRALTGLVPLTSGEIWYGGQKISGRPTVDIVRLGISLVPEGRQLFPYLSVLTNLKLGASLLKDRDEINRNLAEVYRLFPLLQERSKQNAGTLSGGEQQMLAIGRALMSSPTLLCMDEPSLGLAPIIIERLGGVIRDINQKGVSVLLVEQNVHLALDVARTGYALQVGRVVMAGDSGTMKNSDVVRKAYLGA
jgi:branched-chain amino acid transport system ATP-binding protein